MKNKVKYIFFAIFLFMIFSITVFAEDANLNLQCEEGVIKMFKIGGYALYIIKILVPLLLLIFASLDMAKAVISSDQDMIKKQIYVIIKRVIASLIIFLLPTVINFAFTVLVNFDSDLNKYNNLSNCLTKPGVCEIKPKSCP